MAYNDDAVLARLSALNESHDSIATAAQWIMFHRRHADRTVHLWLQRLKDSSAPKRLSLVYLANEVAQQSRIRHKEDFIIAFSPVIAEAAAIAYKGAPADLQAKLKRVLDVWKERTIFEVPIQNAITARIEELEKARGAPKSGFTNSPFATSSIPSEFTKIISNHQKTQKLSSQLPTTVSSASQEYHKQIDPSNAVPSAPVYAARLHGLLKTLATAEGAVAECIKVRQELITELDQMLVEHKTALEADMKNKSELLSRKQEIEAKRQEVELAIMRALGPNEEGLADESHPGNPSSEPGRPEMEALTPPSIELELPEPEPTELQVTESHLDNDSTSRGFAISLNGSNKRRRLADDFPDLGPGDEIDPEVAELLQS